jgi:hypothetical protein
MKCSSEIFCLVLKPDNLRFKFFHLILNWPKECIKSKLIMTLYYFSYHKKKYVVEGAIDTTDVLVALRLRELNAATSVMFSQFSGLRRRADPLASSRRMVREGDTLCIVDSQGEA